MIRVMKKYRVVIWVAAVSMLLVVGGYFLVKGAHFDVLQPAGSIAKQQRDILLTATLLMALIAVPIFIMLGWFAWKYRSNNAKLKKKDYSPEWHENKRLELLWWGIPTAIIIVLAVIAWTTSHSLDPYKSLASNKKPIEVQVVALQWKWLFLYPELGIATVNKLPVPEQTPVHFTISADAPMSAFWVPSLGTQIYAMNGMSSQLHLIADHSGTFAGRSTNINGKGYADMNFSVYAKTENDFNDWVKAARLSPNVLDEAQYERLAIAGTSDEATYQLKNSSLYSTIVNKYMHGMTHDNNDGTHTMQDGTIMKDDDASMNHSGHTMEGM